MSTREWLQRYDRQLKLLGLEGQERLRRARVMVVGVGGLGCAASLYLAAAGVGKILLVDPERVELSNLNRQVLYWARDLGGLKVEVAARKLTEFNPEISVDALAIRVTPDNVEELVSRVDLVVDGLDNWEARLLVNDACVRLGKPFIHAAVEGLRGEMMVVMPGKGPCLRCLVRRPPPNRAPLQVLGATPCLMAMMQVTEAVKIFTGVGEPAIGRLILYDGYQMRFSEVMVRRRPDCPSCGARI
ncbi:MAG: adenylyltransferase [Thermoprotei archaeon]|nr:MAG: adenylyltransferase [Thermoprotei archaeon]